MWTVNWINQQIWSIGFVLGLQRFNEVMSAFYEDMSNKETMLAIRLSDINHAHEQLRFIDFITFRNGNPNFRNIIFDLASQEAYELIMKQVYFFLNYHLHMFWFFKCQNAVIMTEFGLSNKNMHYLSMTFIRILIWAINFAITNVMSQG